MSTNSLLVNPNALGKILNKEPGSHFTTYHPLALVVNATFVDPNTDREICILTMNDGAVEKDVLLTPQVHQCFKAGNYPVGSVVRLLEHGFSPTAK